MVSTTIIILYSYEFILLNLGIMAIYFGVNHLLTERRSKQQKDSNLKDQGFN